MNGFYILAHDPDRLAATLNVVTDALNDLTRRRSSKQRPPDAPFTPHSFAADRFYADSYGSGLLLRGVLQHFLHRYDEAHQSFDEILRMFVLTRSLAYGNTLILGLSNSK